MMAMVYMDVSAQKADCHKMPNAAIYTMKMVLQAHKPPMLLERG